MAEISVSQDIVFDADFQSITKNLLGTICCRQRVGRERSLSIGFGKKIPHGNSRLVDNFYGEWEIGTYTSAWRIVQREEILCGSQDVVDDLYVLDERLSKIKFGRINSVKYLSKFHIQVNCDENISIDFLIVSRDEDEAFHMFCPNGVWIEYSAHTGWRTSSKTLT